MAKLEEIAATFQRERVRFGNTYDPDDVSPCILDCSLEGVGPIVVKAECNQTDMQMGLLYRFYGRWTNHEKYGKQFDAKTFVKVTPLNRGGVIRYLQQAPGIGQKTATVLWDKFNGEAVKICREQPDVAAAAVGGQFTESKAAEASEFLKREAAMEATTIDLMELLAGRGFPRNLAKRAVAEWGNKAAEIIRRSPYSLMRFRGCGFLRTDQLYLDQGGDPAKLKRQALAAWFSLARDTSGSTWHQPALVERGLAERISGVKVAAFEACRLAKRGRLLAVHRNGSGLWLAEAKKAANEATIADRVRTWLQDEFGISIQYREIAGFDGYRVGTDGSVWSMRSNNGGLCDEWKLLKPDECNGGYLRVTMRSNCGEYERRQISHLVLTAFVGKCPDEFVACHGDGNPANNSLSNLRWDTRSENEADKKLHGTSQVGEGNPSAKLTDEQVSEIRKTYSNTEASLNDVAKMFGISKRTVLDIVKYKLWSHVQ